MRTGAGIDYGSRGFGLLWGKTHSCKEPSGRALLVEGDIEAGVTWQRVIEAIEHLQSQSVATSGTLD